MGKGSSSSRSPGTKVVLTFAALLMAFAAVVALIFNGGPLLWMAIAFVFWHPYEVADSQSLRYRETLYFDWHGTEISASGVREDRLEVITGTPYRIVSHPVERQAFPINLGSAVLYDLSFNPEVFRRPILDDSCDLPKDSTSMKLDDAKALIHRAMSIKGECLVPKDNWPLLVTFKDSHDPYSAERILPDEIPDRFPGVTLDRVTVQVTDDPPTTGIENYLPWMKTGLTHGAIFIRAVATKGTNIMKIDGSWFR